MDNIFNIYVYSTYFTIIYSKNIDLSALLSYNKTMDKFMKNYGDIVFSSINQLEPHDKNSKFNIYNCGYFSSSNAGSDHRTQEEFAMILYIHQGFATHTYNGKTYVLKAGDIFIYPPNYYMNIYYHPDKVNERYYIYFDGCDIDDLLSGFNLSYGLYHIDNFIKFIDVTHKIINDFREVGFKNNIYRKALFLEILIKIKESIPNNSNITNYLAILPAIKHMENNYKSKILPLDKYAQMCNVSKSTFIRHFYNLKKTTPAKYFVQLKISNAQLLLTNTNLSISEVAYELAFDDPLYFSRVFHNLTGKSPSEYRKKHI